MKRIIYLFCTIALLVCVSSCKQSNKPSHKVKEFYESMKVKDYEKAAIMVFHNAEAAEQAVYVFKTVDYTLLDYDIIDEEISEGGLEAKVKAKTKFTYSFEGKSETKEGTTEIPLTKIDDEWVINPFNMIN